MISPARIVVIGPESTGKSTLSRALAEALHTAWVPEMARAYLEELSAPYGEGDLLEIARLQAQEEDRLAKQAENVLICDTDLYVIKVWSEHKYGRCDKWILEQIASRKYNGYLLTYPDTPWEDDPQREHPESHMRDYFYRQYGDIVIQSGIPWMELRGSHSERMALALKTIQSWIINT